MLSTVLWEQILHMCRDGRIFKHFIQQLWLGWQSGLRIDDLRVGG